MPNVSNPPSKKVASGVVCANPCIFHGYLVGTDGVNDVTVTLFDKASAASGEEIVPTATYDASAGGINGATGMNVRCVNGIYLELSVAGAGAAEVVVQYAPLR